LDKRINEPDLSIYYQWNYHILKNSPWLTIYEIEDLISNYNVELGMHSYFHDLVYVNGVTEKERMWRMYKISTDEKIMQTLCKMYTIKSALADIGMTVLNNTLCNRNHNQYIEFIKSDTFMCIEWFKKYFGKNDKYAFPFFESSIELIDELKKYGIKEYNMFGKRLNIEFAESR